MASGLAQAADGQEGGNSQSNSAIKKQQKQAAQRRRRIIFNNAKTIWPFPDTSEEYDDVFHDIESFTLNERDAAEIAINALGPDAAAVAPRILEFYSSRRRPRMAASYLSMLTAIGPADRDAIAQHVAPDTLDDTQKDEVQKLLDAPK